MNLHPERQPGECCRTCGAYNFGQCFRGAPLVLLEDDLHLGRARGAVEVDPSGWCPAWRLRPVLGAVTRSGPVLIDPKA